MKKTLILLTLLLSLSGCAKISSTDSSSSTDDVIIDRDNKVIPKMTFERFDVQITQTNVYAVYIDYNDVNSASFIDICEEYFYGHTYYDFRILDISKNADGSFIDETINEDNYQQHLTRIKNFINDESINTIESNTLVAFSSITPFKAITMDFSDTNKNHLYNKLAAFIESQDEYSLYVEPIMQKDFVYLNMEQIIEKINNEESFLLIVTSEFCSHCQLCKDNVITPYLDKYGVTLFHSDVTSEGLYKANDLNIYVKATPTFLVYIQGKLANSTVGCYSEKQFNELFGI